MIEQLLLGITPAYIGPGAGLSAIGALLALIFAVIVAIVGFVWYPVRRIMRNRRKANDNTMADATAEPAERTSTETDE